MSSLITYSYIFVKGMSFVCKDVRIKVWIPMEYQTYILRKVKKLNQTHFATSLSFFLLSCILRTISEAKFGGANLFCALHMEKRFVHKCASRLKNLCTYWLIDWLPEWLFRMIKTYVLIDWLTVWLVAWMIVQNDKDLMKKMSERKK